MESIFCLKAESIIDPVQSPSRTKMKEDLGPESFQKTMDEVERPSEPKVREINHAEQNRAEQNRVEKSRAERKASSDESANPKSNPSETQKSSDAANSTEKSSDENISQAPQDEGKKVDTPPDQEAKTDHSVPSSQEGADSIPEETQTMNTMEVMDEAASEAFTLLDEAMVSELFNLVPVWTEGSAGTDHLDGETVLQPMENALGTSNQTLSLNGETELPAAAMMNEINTAQNQANGEKTQASLAANQELMEDQKTLDLNKVTEHARPMEKGETPLLEKAEIDRSVFKDSSLKAIPNLEEQVLEQVRANLPKTKDEARIPLVPAELGEIKIHIENEQGLSTARFTASEAPVQSLLDQNLDQLKNLLASAGVKVDRIMSGSGNSISAGLEGFNQDGGAGNPLGTTHGKGSSFGEIHRVDMTGVKSESDISQKYGIRNLQSHILDQIRINVDRTNNEARIRLHPPELGEIKIHMVMEDNQLTMRMEVGENLVRTILERDIQQLKNALAEAGIEVNNFDINSGEPRSHREQAGFNSSGDSQEHFSDNNTQETENNMGTPRGPVRLSAAGEGVDYLVY